MLIHLTALKRLLILSLVALGLSACATKAPKMAPVEVFVHAPDNMWKCANSVYGKCPEVPNEKTIGWTAFKPAGIEVILNYISTLKCLIDGACNAEVQTMNGIEYVRVTNEKGVTSKWVRTQDVKEAHSQLMSTMSSLKKQYKAASPK